MAPDEFPLRCLAARVAHDLGGEIDTLEREAFLNEVAGSGHRISAQQWLITDPPAEVEGEVTLPPFCDRREVGLRARLRLHGWDGLSPISARVPRSVVSARVPGAHHHDRKQRGIQARRSVAARGRGRSYPRVFGRATLVGRSGRTPIHRVVRRPRNMVGTDRHLCNRRASCRAGAVLFFRGRHILSAPPPTLRLGWLRCRVPGPRPACRPLCPGRPKGVDHVGSELQSQRSDVRAWIAGGPDDWWLNPLWSLVRIRPHADSQKRACWTAAHLTQRW